MPGLDGFRGQEAAPCGDGEAPTPHPRRFVLAAGMEGFKGEGHPSRSHPGREACRGKRVEVIGPDDPARHICADVFESGGDVTMVQLKTGMAGLPTPVYGLAVTHHAG